MIISTCERILIISWLLFFISEPVNASEVIPCFVKLSLVSDVRTIGVDSSTNNMMLASEHFDCFAPFTVGNMKDSVWVQFRKFCNNGVYKLVRGFESSLLEAIPESEIRDKTGEKNTTGDSVKVSDDILGHWVT